MNEDDDAVQDQENRQWAWEVLTYLDQMRLVPREGPSLPESPNWVLNFECTTGRDIFTVLYEHRDQAVRDAAKADSIINAIPGILGWRCVGTCVEFAVDTDFGDLPRFASINPLEVIAVVAQPSVAVGVVGRARAEARVYLRGGAVIALPGVDACRLLRRLQLWGWNVR